MPPAPCYFTPAQRKQQAADNGRFCRIDDGRDLASARMFIRTVAQRGGHE